MIAATAYHLGHSLRRAGRVQEALTVSERAYEAVMRQWWRSAGSVVSGLGRRTDIYECDCGCIS